MKRAKKASFKLAADMDVVRPQKERAFPIPEPEWQFLRKKVEDIEEPNRTYSSIGSFFLGVASSALVTTFTVPPSQSSNIAVISFVVFLCAALLGLAFLFFDDQAIRKHQRATRGHVLEEMTRLEARFAGR